uniref:Fish-egg lectin-like n=1 Tax=Leptobrachium leishanense TaxID=445787 RepID=A0A8C5MTZ1_9ANUR
MCTAQRKRRGHGTLAVVGKTVFFSFIFNLLNTSNAGLQCTLIPGWLKQLDAGAGQVYGVNDNDEIYRLNGNDWVNIQGRLIHVSVGLSGLWGANRGNNIYKMQDGNWVQVAGALKQVDAGGRAHLVGVNGADNVYCLNQDTTFSRGTNVPFIQIDGNLKYYSCGLYGCWGVNNINDIYHRLNVNSENCKGSEWRRVDGKLVMVETSSDGAVYGINTVGQIYKREGISDSNPIGTKWSLVNIFGPFKHLSYDGGILWLINKDGNIFKCEDKKTCCEFCINDA